MSALPFLPGNSFSDPTKSRYHVSQTLSYKNGYALSYRPKFGIGGEPIPQNQLSESDLDQLANAKPTLTYGEPTQPAPVEFVPAHVAFDKKVLLFNAFFKQTVHESPNEFYRVREVKIYYYLEDDSMCVMEPQIENSGIPQGRLIKRQKLPKNDLGDLWHWKDLNVGINVTFYGKTFHVYDCDKWTANFLRSEGIELNQPEDVELDPYRLSRHQPLNAHKTPSMYDKLRQFLELDRKVLRFYSVWDDRDNMFGEVRPYIIHYFLVDDTVEIREVHEPNDGKDPFPILLCRQRLPKKPGELPTNFPTVVLEATDDEIKDYFSPKDFMIGITIYIMGRRFLIHDCDEFTKQFYRINFGIQDFQPLRIAPPTPKPAEQIIAPYNGIGSLEDSKQSCLSLVPQPPRKDVMKMLENDGKTLRYSATLDSSNPDDKGRSFIITFKLSDDTLTIFEKTIKNAGIIGGKFLECMRVPKPGSPPDNPDFFGPHDFIMGAVIDIFKHKFIITGADKYVLKYMEARPDEFSKEVIEPLRNKFEDVA